MKGKRMIIKKIFATLLLTILILNNCINIFSIFDSSVFAADTDVVIELTTKNGNIINDDAQIFSMDAMGMVGNGKYIEVSINVGNISFKGIDLKLTYDSSKIVPSQIGKGQATLGTWNDPLASGLLTTSAIEFNSETGLELDTTSELNTTDNTIRLTATSGTAYNSSGTTMVMKLAFRLVDESLTEEDLTQDILNLVPVGSSLPNGFKIIYSDGSSGTIAPLLSYEGFAEVQKTVSSIVIKTPPSDTVYDHGETISKDGGVITVTYADDGGSEDISMTDENVTITPTIANAGNTTVTVEYRGKTTTFEITVNNPITAIEMVSYPKQNYYTDEDFTVEGGTIKLTYANEDESQPIPIDENWVRTSTIPDLSLPTELHRVIIDYPETSLNTYYEITVIRKAVSFEIDTENPPIDDYYVGDSFQSGGRIKINYADGGSSSVVNITESMLSGFDTSVEATQLPITITYKDEYGNTVPPATADANVYKIDVVRRPVEGQEGVIINPNDKPKSTYLYGDSFVEQGSLIATYEDGSSSEINITESMLRGEFPTTPGTHTIELEYAGHIVSYNIVIQNYVVDAEFVLPTNNDYLYGDDLSTILSGGLINLTWADGDETSTIITSNMVSEYNSTLVDVPQTLTITYEEELTGDSWSSEDYVITLQNYPVDMILVPPTGAMEYQYGDTIDFSSGSVQIKMANGEFTPENPVPLTDSRITLSDYDNTDVTGTQQITVTFEGYEEFAKTFNVKFNDYIEDVEMGQTPKQDYLYNEPLNVANGTIKVKYRSYTDYVEIDMTTDMVTGYDSHNIQGTQTLIVTYEGIEVGTYTVTVSDYITEIEVVPPTNTVYNLGEASELDLTGGQVREVYASGATKDYVNLTPNMVSGYNPNVEGEQTITVTYQGKTTTFTVTVQDDLANVKSVEIEKVPETLEYTDGETIDLTGGKIRVTYDDDSYDIFDMTTSNITFLNGDKADSSKLVNGVQKVEIQYKQFVQVPDPLSFDITIKNNIESISIYQMPKTNYSVGDTLDVTDGMLEITYSDGTTKPVPMTSDMVTGFNSSQVTDSQTLTVTYTENGVTLETSYNISVQDLQNTITSVEIKEYPKIDYTHGENIDLTGGMLEITYADGHTETVYMTSDEVTLLTQTADVSTGRIRFEYKGQTYAFDIEVANPIKSIQVNNTPKTEYGIGEPLDLTNGTILVTYMDNSTKEVQITTDMISGFDSSVEVTNKEITVTYTEDGVTQQTSYNVNIAKPVIKSNLNIVKYVSVINNEVVTENIPRLERVNGQVKYVVNNDNLEVENGDEITFNIRIYNTGNAAEYVESVMEKLPSHLQFVADNEINIRNGWTQVDGNTVKTNVLSKVNDLDGTNIIEAYDEQDTEPPYKELQLVLKVLSQDENASGESTTILEETINGEGEQTKAEEDQTNITIKLVTFDLEINKYISKITQLNTYNQDSVVKNIAKTDGVTKIELYRNDVEYTKLLVEYTLDITNKGTGTATLDQLVEQIPNGLTFASDINSDWTTNGTQVVNTSLNNTKLTPGQTVSAKIVLQWEGEDNLGSITNKASIVSSEDRVSTNNEDTAVLLVSIVTAGAVTYMMLAAAVVGVFGSGVYLIKRFII